MIAFTARDRRLLHWFFATCVLLAVLASSGEVLFQEYREAPVDVIAAGGGQRDETPDCPPVCSCLCACPCTPAAGILAVSIVPEWLANRRLHDPGILSTLFPRTDAPEPHFRPPLA